IRREGPGRVGMYHRNLAKNTDSREEQEAKQQGPYVSRPDHSETASIQSKDLGFGKSCPAEPLRCLSGDSATARRWRVPSQSRTLSLESKAAGVRCQGAKTLSRILWARLPVALHPAIHEQRTGPPRGGEKAESREE